MSSPFNPNINIFSDVSFPQLLRQRKCDSYRTRKFQSQTLYDMICFFKKQWFETPFLRLGFSFYFVGFIGLSIKNVSGVFILFCGFYLRLGFSYYFVGEYFVGDYIQVANTFLETVNLLAHSSQIEPHFLDCLYPFVFIGL